MRRPSTAALSSAGGAGSHQRWSSTSIRSIRLPSTAGARWRLIVSTSGSSGMPSSLRRAASRASLARGADLGMRVDDTSSGRRPLVELRPLSASDAPELQRIHATPEVVRWWDVPAEGFPLTDDPDSTRFTITVDGAVAGLIQFGEETEPRYRHATIDLFLDPALHGRGIGTEALRQLVRRLIDERGHHRITIDPAAANAAAIRAYEKAGFRPVGILRRYERDAHGGDWHDGLLMELVAGER